MKEKLIAFVKTIQGKITVGLLVLAAVVLIAKKLKKRK